jgi:glycosyltransferase involved in cell wall biosynthesis
VISVVIPAYDEADAIGATVAKVRAVLQSLDLPGSEIVVVDDGSADGTGDKAREAGARVLINPHNLGYGWSLKRGIEAASHETIVIIDADSTYPPDAIGPLLQEYRRGFDMVVGQRSGAHYRESALKAPLRWILRFLVEYAAGRRVPDVNSGLRMFDRATAMTYFAHLCNTFSFTTSMTLAYMMNGKFVSYYPISYDERVGRSKVHLLRDSLRTLQYIMEAVIYFNPLKAFLLLFVLLTIGGIGCFLIAALTHLNAPYYLGIGSLMVAVLSLCLGFLAVLLKQIMLLGAKGAADVREQRNDHKQ